MAAQAQQVENKEKRIGAVLSLPRANLPMIEIKVADGTSTMAGAFKYLSANEPTRANKFETLMDCVYKEVRTDSDPLMVPIKGCLFAMVVGADDPIGVAHIPSGMIEDEVLQLEVVMKLVARLKADSNSKLYLAGLGERRNLTDKDPTFDAARLVSRMNEDEQQEYGRRWNLFKIITDQMTKPENGISLSRLVLSVKGSGDFGNEDAANVVVVIPSKRECVVCY